MRPKFNRAPKPKRSWRVLSALLGLTVLGSAGCQVNSFFDPSKTGYFGTTPVTMPVLDRIAAIEPAADPWGKTTSVTREDLLPSDLGYRLHPGDVIEVQIYELYTPGQFFPFTGRVDPAGELQIPTLGAIPAAGYTIPELHEEIVAQLSKNVMSNPTVNVNLMEGGALTYTLYGHINQPGRFTLQDPNLRLLDALAMAGGVPLSTRRIYVVRQVAVDRDLHPPWHEMRRGDRPASETKRASSEAPVDIESLINQLQDAPSVPAEKQSGSTEVAPAPSPGAWEDSAAPPIDIEDLTPAAVRLPHVAGNAAHGMGHHEESTPYVFLPDQNRWVQRRHASVGPSKSGDGDELNAGDLIVERVIEVPYKRLSHGDMDLNLIIRPSDQIYVDGPEVGLVYISGEVRQPNAYALPSTDRITLSRVIAMAGGLSSLAIPDRVDLVRQLDEGREATIRLDLGAIRRRTEPDVVLKPNDHILVGTNWFAYPLAVFRNGFRMNYGFGFLLDRNFGNDVFGAPPVNFR
ncbi:MAG: SLBB domain-containing protein [Phycisphaerales bacterium]|nr:SLBB domain-containing protein [Phycisphaerales bacterium]